MTTKQDMIEAAYRDDPSQSYSSIARCVGCSKQHVSRCIQERFGVPKKAGPRKGEVSRKYLRRLDRHGIAEGESLA